MEQYAMHVWCSGSASTITNYMYVVVSLSREAQLFIMIIYKPHGLIQNEILLQPGGKNMTCLPPGGYDVDIIDRLLTT